MRQKVCQQRLGPRFFDYESQFDEFIHHMLRRFPTNQLKKIFATWFAWTEDLYLNDLSVSDGQIVSNG